MGAKSIILASNSGEPGLYGMSRRQIIFPGYLCQKSSDFPQQSDFKII